MIDCFFFDIEMYPRHVLWYTSIEGRLGDTALYWHEGSLSIENIVAEHIIYAHSTIIFNLIIFLNFKFSCEISEFLVDYCSEKGQINHH